MAKFAALEAAGVTTVRSPARSVALSERLRIAIAQINPVVGDVPGNQRMIEEFLGRATADGADLVVYPELALSGYPPEDLLFHGGFRRRLNVALERLERDSGEVVLVVGYPHYDGDVIYNAVAVMQHGRRLATYFKRIRPNYGVFDEKRYFAAGRNVCVFEVEGVPVGVTICEDLWAPGPVEDTAAAGAALVVNVNASPFDYRKQQERENTVRERIATARVPVLYAHMAGGQDELVFDGRSFVMDAAGELCMRAPAMTAGLYHVDLHAGASGLVIERGVVAPEPPREALIYDALVLAVRDYLGKHRFPGALVGLSGGIDSALTLAIAVDALGADRVRAVMMPSRFTSSMSLEDAREQASRLGVQYDVISIEPVFESVLTALGDVFAGAPFDTTEENIQSRSRGLILMAMSNKTGRLLLTTGNKSEMAVGYATLYGDMAGGFAPIKDCTKTLVYDLARYRNTLGEMIPARVITREPTAELRADQRDSDSLPPYEVLDPILDALIIEDMAVSDIVARGFDRATVIRVLDMVRKNEYKRRQAPPGVRISPRAFGRDWRYPITSGYHLNEDDAVYD
jgi:NAD+ synthase (glutamine-hydrolysing)